MKFNRWYELIGSKIGSVQNALDSCPREKHLKKVLDLLRLVDLHGEMSGAKMEQARLALAGMSQNLVYIFFTIIGSQNIQNALAVLEPVGKNNTRSIDD